jgi:hypothetical protein
MKQITNIQFSKLSCQNPVQFSGKNSACDELEQKQILNSRLKDNENFTYKSTTQFVKHPMLGGIEPLQMLLQSSCFCNSHKNHQNS